MDNDYAIQVKGVYKDFRLPHEKAGSVKSIFTNMFRYISTARSFDTQHALKDISFEIKKGEFFGIVGRNGSGKSTLLKILAGIYQPNKGTVKVDGRLVPFIELGVGFNGELTGRENVYLNGALLGFSKEEIDEQYEDIVAFAELERFMDQKLKNYSSGMQVRLAFSLAIRAEADILLVDEVLAVGDADFQRKCFNHFRELKKQQKTVIFVSHDMSAVREYCDRAIMIEKSEIVTRGTADDIAVEYIKLFNKQDMAGQQRQSDDRWGDQGIVLTAVEAKQEKGTFNLKVAFKVNEDAEEPVIGYLIKDAAGNELVGSNNKLMHHRIGTVKKGEKYELTFKMPNVFNDGIFVATVAASHNDGVTQYDWWENAASFTVVREDKTPFALNPHAEIEIVKKK